MDSIGVGTFALILCLFVLVLAVVGLFLDWRKDIWSRFGWRGRRGRHDDAS